MAGPWWRVDRAGSGDQTRGIIDDDGLRNGRRGGSVFVGHREGDDIGAGGDIDMRAGYGARSGGLGYEAARGTPVIPINPSRVRVAHTRIGKGRAQADARTDRRR